VKKNVAGKYNIENKHW